MSFDFLPLNLFPQGSLASSVVTTVWIGVFVVAFFNLRFGWVLSGLVVPGYLVPLMIIKPWSLVAIMVEALATYGLARLLVGVSWRFGVTEVFGRDRFFLLILISVIMRLLFDVWGFPALGAWLAETQGIRFDYRNNLHSFGLVIIALIANQLWKPGLWRGMGTLLVQLVVTFLLVRYGLMVLTNFSISNLGFLYEDIAASIQAGPKAYIILLLSAWIASRMNLRYGWDYNGILIPSLLALQWYEPTKLLATFIEAFLILFVARMLLRLPALASHNIEGARLLLLFFNIGFFYKLLLGYALLYWFPQVQVSDYYAFGYLLATLLAMKMYEKSIALRMTRTTLQTSLVAVIFASFIGFALTQIPDAEGDAVAQGSTQAELQVRVADERLEDLVAEYKLALVSRRGQTMPVPVPVEAERFEQVVRQLLLAAQSKQAPRPDTLVQLEKVGYELVRTRDEHWVLFERAPVRGWGLFVINPAAENELLLEVPYTQSEKEVAEAGVRLLGRLKARGLALAGARAKANIDGSSDVLLSANTLFLRFHRVLAAHNVLQLRRYGATTARQLFAERLEPGSEALARLPATLWIKRRLPDGLSLTALRDLVDDFDSRWQAPGFDNIQRQQTYAGFAELLLSQRDLRTLLTRTSVDLPENEQATRALPIEQPLEQWLRAGKTTLAGKDSQRYRVPEEGELRYMDEEVLKPLWALLQHPLPDGRWTEEAEAELSVLTRKAAVLGYRLSTLDHRATGEHFVALYEFDYTAESEPAHRQRRYWGTYLFRAGSSNPYLVEVPRPLFEQQTYEFGVSLFERLKGTALLLAGAHPLANADGRADATQAGNKLSLFNLVHQVWSRESAQLPLLSVQVRALGSERAATAGRSLLALDTWNERPEQFDRLSRNLMAQLGEDGIAFERVQGLQSTAGMEFGLSPQALYSLAIPDHHYAVLWLAPELRQRYRQRLDSAQELAQFALLGWPSIEGALEQALREATPGKRSLATGLVDDLNRYLEFRDIVTLRRLQQRYPDVNWHRYADLDSGQSFVWISDQNHRLLGLVNLNPGAQQTTLSLRWPPDAARLSAALKTRVTWLLPEVE